MFSLLRRIFSGYLHAGSLARRLGPQRFVSDGAFVTKTGDYCTIFKIDGFDWETTDQQTVVRTSAKFGKILTTGLSERHTLYQWILKSNRPVLQQETHYGDGPEMLLLNRRAEFMESRRDSLYSIELYFAIMYTPDSMMDLSATNDAATVDRLQRREAAAIEALADTGNSILAPGGDMVSMHVLDNDETFTFLRRILCLDRDRAEVVKNLGRVDQLDFRIADPIVEHHGSHIEVDDLYVQTSCLRTEPTPHTMPNMMRELLEIDCNFVACSTWKPRPNIATRKHIKSLKNNFDGSRAQVGSTIFHMFVGDNTRPPTPQQNKSTDKHIDTVDAALIEIEHNARHYGLFSLTVAFYHDQLDRVRRSRTKLDSILGTRGASTLHEKRNLINSFLAMLPGNNHLNVRKLHLHNENYADMSFIWNQQQGSPINTHLDAECLSIFETQTGMPYYFNLHVNDLCGVMVSGRTGAGKTFLSQTLLSSIPKYTPHPRMLVLDIAGSYKPLVDQIGGAYYRLSASGSEVTINPFRLESTPDNWQFLAELLKMMIRSDAQYAFTDKDSLDLYDGIRGVYRLPAHRRHLSNIALPQHLYRRLRRWMQNGQFGWVFDNVEDTLDFSHFTCVEFHELHNRFPEVLNVLQFYLMQRWDDVLFDPEQLGTFKFLAIDEGWRFALQSELAEWFIAKTKTNRARNAGFMFITHSPLDTDRVGIAKLLTEACPMQILLHNPTISKRDYREMFHLNDVELETVIALEAKKQFLVKTPYYSVVLNHYVDEQARLLFCTDPKSVLAKRAIERERILAEAG